jgi:TetR/AcrR family transcriptional regulator
MATAAIHAIVRGLTMQPTTAMKPLVLELGVRAERTRMAILAAAEQQFARRGFVATRLEDVAAAVDLKRAALFYHFRDKQALYNAVVADAFGSLAVRLQEAFVAPEPIAVRVELAVEAWVDTVLARPTLARLILRHAAEADEHDAQGIFPNASHFMTIGAALYEQARASGEFKPVYDDPFQVASAVTGATVFYVTALAPLIPGSQQGALTPERAAAHKRDVVRMVRLLLGTTPASPAARGGKAVPKKRGTKPARKSSR